MKSQTTLLLLSALWLVATPLARAVTSDARRAGPVDDDPELRSDELQQRGADDIDEALLLDPRVSLSSQGPLYLLGVDLSHWSLRWHGAPLLRSGDVRADRVVLLRGDRLKLRSGPSLSAFGETGTAGSIVVTARPPRPHNGVQLAQEIRAGAAGRLRADAGVFVQTQRWQSSVQISALRDLQQTSRRALVLRGRHRVVLSSRARAEFLIEQQTQAFAELSSLRSLVQLGSTMDLSPQQQIVMRITRQDLTSDAVIKARGRHSQLGETLLEARFLGALIQGHEVDLGLDARLGSGQRREGSFRQQTRRSSAAAHLADRWHIRPSLRFDGSLRAEVDDVIGPAVSGRAALVYVLRPRWMLRGAVASALRAPPLAWRWQQGGPRGVQLFPHVSDLGEQGQGVRLSFGYENGEHAWLRLSYEPVTLDRTIAVDPELASSTHGRLHTQWVGLNSGLTLPGAHLRLRFSHYYMFDGRDDWSGRSLSERPNHLTRLRLTAQPLAGGQVFVDVQLASLFAPLGLDLQSAPQLRGSAGVEQRVFGGLLVRVSLDARRRLTPASWSTTQGLALRCALYVDTL